MSYYFLIEKTGKFDGPYGDKEYGIKVVADLLEDGDTFLVLEETDRCHRVAQESFKIVSANVWVETQT